MVEGSSSSRRTWAAASITIIPEATTLPWDRVSLGRSSTIWVAPSSFTVVETTKARAMVINNGEADTTVNSTNSSRASVVAVTKTARKRVAKVEGSKVLVAAAAEEAIKDEAVAAVDISVALHSNLIMR